ncbi:c-type cytochrome biogenesis protein CcsB [Motilibacter sp. E257]|uniref:C-type cytochrome biogenesis protein CcsB n=2 Tax=Motilibacter deserti TaxID=2714956 RepID=A0ABX0GXR4_9ACTN|nr:c-type cytochrome biogenesis protein CcsB [Motilibacter deserti]
MAVYALAMLCSFVELALGRPVPTEAAVREPARAASRRAVAAEGSVLTEERPPAPPAAPAPASGPDAGRWGRIAVSFTIVAALLHLAAVVCRGIAAGRAPWGNMYEFAIAGSFAAVAVFLVALRRWPIRLAGVVVVPFALLVLGLAVTVLYTEPEELVPSLQSYWLVIHVAAAIISTGAFTLGAVLSAAHWWRLRTGDEKRLAGIALPPAQRLDTWAYRVHVFTFPVWTFAVMAGAIWAENAWGRYWGWDPKETWALITWIVYAGYLHARATTGWRGWKSDAIALAGYAALLFNFIGVNVWLGGIHAPYSGV